MSLCIVIIIGNYCAILKRKERGSNPNATVIKDVIYSISPIQC